MGQEPTMTWQKEKAQHTKDQILRATKRLLKQYGYEGVSIKNICEAAGVSNGSFYHHFKSKDELMSHYVQNVEGSGWDAVEHTQGKTVKGVIMDMYLNYAAYCRKIGIDFISNYYSTKNQVLNYGTRPEGNYPTTPLLAFLKQQQEEGRLAPGVQAEEMLTDIRIIVIGNIFEWCVSKDTADFEGNLRRSLGRYLDRTTKGDIIL